MSGQLVIAELEAFRAVLSKAQRRDGATIKVWCRSTITNALHRTGPSEAMTAAAETAWTASDHLAQRLDEREFSDDDVAQGRQQALQALAALIAAVRLVNPSPADL